MGKLDKVVSLICVLMIALMIGFTLAWNIQEKRRLECGAGWYATLELVNYLMEERSP